MINRIFLITALLLAGITAGRAQISGWSYNDDFPWVYLDDDQSWAYFYVSDGAYWLYVQETQEYRYLAPLNGPAPESLAGLTIFGLRGNDPSTGLPVIFVFEYHADGTYLVPDLMSGTYTYQKESPNIGTLVRTVDGYPEVTYRDVIQFSDATSGFFMSALLHEGSTGGDEGFFGNFDVIDE